MVLNKGLDELDDFCLLPPGQLGSFLEELPHLATLRTGWLGLVAEQLFDRATQCIGNRPEQIGAGSFPRVLPIGDVGVLLPDATGKFALGDPGSQSQPSQVGAVCSTAFIHDLKYSTIFKKKGLKCAVNCTLMCSEIGLDALQRKGALTHGEKQ